MDFYGDKGQQMLKKCDILISNPPFSLKYKIMKQLVDLDKPFILILPLSCITTKSYRSVFNGKTDRLTLLIPQGRMLFINKKTNKLERKTTFENCYVCYKIETNKPIVYL